MTTMTAANDVPVDPTNAQQLNAWDGDEGSYWAEHADFFDRSMSGHHDKLFEVAAIGPVETVLDIGCGAGKTTRDAARAAKDGSALGVDLSGPMLAVARRRADEEGITNASFVHADAQVHGFTAASFDIAISRAGAMFFGDKVAAFTNIGRALRESGRLVLLAWQPFQQNEWMRETMGALAAGRDLPMPPIGAPGPFGLADPDHVRTVLSASGFTDIAIDPWQADLWLGDDLAGAEQALLGTLGWLLRDLDDAGRSRALDDLADPCAPRLILAVSGLVEVFQHPFVKRRAVSERW
jgi:SAM-dependent methyltransferase